MISRRTFSKQLAGAIAAILSPGARARPLRGLASGTASPPRNYIGGNLNGITYYDSEFKFLNALKQASGNTIGYPGDNYTLTPAANGPGDLHLDADGYVTSMVTISGTTLTNLQMMVYVNTENGSDGTPPTVTNFYPPGPYRHQFSGKTKITYGGDVTSISSTSTGVTVSGLSVDTTGSSGVVNVTVNLASPLTNFGIYFNFTAMPDNVNYYQAASFVQSSLTSSYDGGEIFRPDFKASIAPYARLRGMDVLNTNGQTPRLNFGNGAIANGFSGNISLYWFENATYTGSPIPWPLPTGTYNIAFSNGQVIACGCVCGSATINVPTPLTSAVAAVAAYYDAQAWYLVNGPTPTANSWAGRAKPSNHTWATWKGIPLEVFWQLCNEMSADPWTCAPMGCDTSYYAGAAALCHTGSGSGLSGFTGLSSSLVEHHEVSNEVWNFNFNQGNYAQAMGAAAWPTSSSNVKQEWYGSLVYKAGLAWQTEYGSAFGTKVLNFMGSQTAGTFSIYSDLNVAMSAPDWFAAGNPAPKTLVHAVHGFGYFTTAGNGGGMSTTDQNNILSYSSLNAQVTEFFRLAYTNVGYTSSGGAYTYSSVPSDGFIGSGSAGSSGGDLSAVAAWISSLRATTSVSFNNIPVHGYEIGSSWDQSGNGLQSGFMPIIYAAHRDARMALLYYDPSNQLYSTYGYTAANGKTGFLPGLQTAGMVRFNQFGTCGQMTQYGEWGAIESVMQTLSPLSSAPPKYQGIANWAAA